MRNLACRMISQELQSKSTSRSRPETSRHKQFLDPAHISGFLVHDRVVSGRSVYVSLETSLTQDDLRLTAHQRLGLPQFLQTRLVSTKSPSQDDSSNLNGVERIQPRTLSLVAGTLLGGS